MGESILFYLFAFVAVLAGTAILIGRDIVRLAYWLIVMLASVAGLYFLLGAYLIGSIQLIVYVGGVSVLVVFGVMLSSRRMTVEMFARGWELALSSLLALVILSGLIVALLSTHWTVSPAQASSAQDLGHLLLDRYVGPFELASVLLLVVLLGAGYLARPHRPRPDKPSEQREENPT